MLKIYDNLPRIGVRALGGIALLLAPLWANATLLISSEPWQSPPITGAVSAPLYIPAEAAYSSAAVAPNHQQFYDNLASEHEPTLLAAEAMAQPAAQKVLQQARRMTLDERFIIRGGCWDYLNEVFHRAGIERETVFKGSYSAGPYVDVASLRSGDWLYYINHGYNDIEHSGLFVGWLDKPSRQALILSYAGERRREPARYKVYDLSHVYQVMRPVE